mmetsp:Transcript_18431/g.18091  ORF Transcript_18431/g.18091 Transcript_18431/m.18091 type:complete len:109 (+) Transcript_18431:478-804(+)
MKIPVDLARTGRRSSLSLKRLILLRVRRTIESRSHSKFRRNNRHICTPNTDKMKNISDKRTNQSNMKLFKKKSIKKMKEQNQIIEIDPEMDYKDAIGFIHSHIMSLDI